MQMNTHNTVKRSTEPRLISWPKLIPFLLAACLAIATGCRDDDPSRYPSVEVPGYEAKDYVADLSHPNPEIVFNAVCILTPGASDMGKTLNGVRTDPPSEAYRTAQAVHQGVFPLLQSRDPRLVAVSLRFFQFFGSTYKDKSGFITTISQIQSAHPLVQFEQVTALSVLVTNTAQLPAPLLRRLLHSPSWMVSRATYQLIDKLQDETLRVELLGRYASAPEEREKLLILTAFAHAPGPKATEFLQQELLTTDKQTIRVSVASILVSHLNIHGVGAWLAEQYPRLSPEARHAVISQVTSSDTDEEAWADLFSHYLTQGYQPDGDYMQVLNKIFDDANKPLPARLQRLDQALKAHPTLAEAWKARRAEHVEAKAHFAALQKEYPALAEELTAKAQAMFAKHKIPADRQQQYLAGLAKLDSLKP